MAPRWQQAPVIDPTQGMTAALQPAQPAQPAQSRWQQAPVAQETWGEWAMGLPLKAFQAAFPERDPETADIPGFAGQGIFKAEDLSRIERSKLTAAGFEDKAWRQAILETLGPRVKGLRQDKFGNEIVTYTGDDGKEYETYINRPGLDWQDVERTVSGAIPYVVGAGAARRLLGPLGKSLLARMPAQAAAAGAVSIGQDVTADQPVDLPKAGMTAALGGVGEVAGTIAPKIWRWLFQPRFVDEATGTLTEAGRRQAQRLGLDPDQVQGEVARRLHEIRRTADPRAAAAGIESGEFGIPTTLGQRTKDPAQLGVEEQMRRSLFGPGAREVISEFDTHQAQAIQQAAEGIRSRVAPAGAASIPEAGQGISEGMRAAQAASRRKVQEAWEKVGELYPVLTETKTGSQARNLLTQHLRQQFDDLGFFPDQALTPNAHKMMKSLESYAKSVPERIEEVYPLLGQSSKRIPSIDTMRRRLLAMYQNAAPGQDKAAARAIYAAFNDWLEDAAAQQIVRTEGMKFASKTAAKPIEEARKITRQQRALLEPRTVQGRLTPAGKILTEIAENADTPERVIQTLFGASTATTPKAGTVQAIKRLKIVLPPEKFDQVKAAYFMKMVTGRDGKMLTPGALNASIEKTFASQKSVVDQLFDKTEQELIRRFQKAVETASYKPPNVSGTSYELERMRRQRSQGALNYTLRRLGTRATFQGRVWQGTMFHWLARALPNVFNAQDAASRALARKAIEQTMEFKPDTGELMAAIAAAHEARKRQAR